MRSSLVAVTLAAAVLSLTWLLSSRFQGPDGLVEIFGYGLGYPSWVLIQMKASMATVYGAAAVLFGLLSLALDALDRRALGKVLVVFLGWTVNMVFAMNDLIHAPLSLAVGLYYLEREMYSMLPPLALFVEFHHEVWCVMLVGAASLCAAWTYRPLGTRALARAAAVVSAIVLPLPVEVYFWDSHWFYLHVTNLQIGTWFVWFSNADLLCCSVAGITGALLLELRKSLETSPPGHGCPTNELH